MAKIKMMGAMPSQFGIPPVCSANMYAFITILTIPSDALEFTHPDSRLPQDPVAVLAALGCFYLGAIVYSQPDVLPPGTTTQALPGTVSYEFPSAGSPERKSALSPSPIECRTRRISSR